MDTIKLKSFLLFVKVKAYVSWGCHGTHWSCYIHCIHYSLNSRGLLLHNNFTLACSFLFGIFPLQFVLIVTLFSITFDFKSYGISFIISTIRVVMAKNWRHLQQASQVFLDTLLFLLIDIWRSLGAKGLICP